MQLKRVEPKLQILFVPLNKSMPFHSPPRKFVWLSCLTILCWFTVQPGWAAGSKRRDPSIAVRFHAQVNTFDPTFAAQVKVGNPPRQIIVEKIPSISERDIAGFYPYKAADGTFAAVIQLDRHGSVVLEALSTEKRGQIILAAVNTRPVAPLLVDKTISDGIIYIPSGLTLDEIHAMGASFSLMGQTENDKEARAKPKESTFSDPNSRPTYAP